MCVGRRRPPRQFQTVDDFVDTESTTGIAAGAGGRTILGYAILSVRRSVFTGNVLPPIDANVTKGGWDQLAIKISMNAL